MERGDDLLFAVLDGASGLPLFDLCRRRFWSELALFDRLGNVVLVLGLKQRQLGVVSLGGKVPDNGIIRENQAARVFHLVGGGLGEADALSILGEGLEAVLFPRLVRLDLCENDASVLVRLVGAVEAIGEAERRFGQFLGLEGIVRANDDFSVSHCSNLHSKYVVLLGY